MVWKMLKNELETHFILSKPLKLCPEKNRNDSNSRKA